MPRCNRRFPQEIGRGRPCLNAHIGKCMAVCSGKISCENYNEAVKSAVHLIRYGKKDILKINEVIDLNYEMLGYIDPHITVNIIRGGERMEKIHPHLPETITGVIRCKNPRCITSIEQELPHIFRLTDREHGVYRCLYCDTKGGKR